MKGVQFSFDRKGDPRFVVIDVQKNPGIWEDFYDYMTLDERPKGIPIPFEKVVKELKQKRIKSSSDK